MQLSQHFTLEELIFSETATRLGIDNTPSKEVIENLKRLSTLAEKIRTLLGNNPLLISSGYRSPTLNTKIRGAKTSAHLEGRAIDFRCPAFGTPLEIARFIQKNKIECDQCIQEGTWVHIAISRVNEPSRNQFLTADFSAGKAIYSNGV